MKGSTSLQAQHAGTGRFVGDRSWRETLQSSISRDLSSLGISVDDGE